MFRIKSRKKKTVLSICSISMALLLVAAFALQLPLMSYRYVRDQILEWRTRNLPALIQEKRAEMSCFYNNSRQHGQDAYIAHGGGIGQYTYTNSVEGFEDSIAKGFKFIEVDLLETVDGHLIGAHDWKTLSEHTGRDEVELRKMPLCELEKLKINDKFQILSGGGILRLMLENPQVILVTDKIQNFELLVKEIPLTNRMIVEVAGGDSIHGVYNYQKAIQSGIKYPAYSSPTSIEYAEKYNFPLIVMNAKALTEDPILLEKACALHSKGVTIMVYNTQFVDKKDFIFKYLGNTVSMIYTDKWYPNGASPVSEEEVDKFN